MILHSIEHTFFFVDIVIPIGLFHFLSLAMHETWFRFSTFAGYTMTFFISLTFFNCTFYCFVGFNFISIGTFCIAEFKISGVLVYNVDIEKKFSPLARLNNKWYRNIPKL